MIGIFTEKKYHKTVMEFFQLFKTPWEFLKKDQFYDIIFTTDDLNEGLPTKLIVIFGSDEKKIDSKYDLSFETTSEKILLNYNNILFPVYKGLSTFKTEKKPIIKTEGRQNYAGIEITANSHRIIRIGYNLFKELDYILSKVQPKEFAAIPTVEIHIGILRDLIIKSGIPFYEIPPVPRGYDFIICLTHDVDFGGIRNYKFDHTMYGFLYRALLSSIIKFIKRKITFEKLLTNLKAVFLLPAVYLGLSKDFWIDFDQYMEIEKDIKSTYFFLPFKKQSGMHEHGKAPARRASKYDITDSKPYIENLRAAGNEIGLHGINAWLDAEKGVEEFLRITSTAGISKIGVRMHWLYFNGGSAKELEKAGFYYDTTIGYNDAVGFAAGTTQVFRPLSAERLLEIPMHIMDTALFYTGRMALTEDEAFSICKRLIENSIKYGGVLVINWHQRSLAPERLWSDFYISLLNLIKKNRVWFTTCKEAVKWFEKRREIRFEEARIADKIILRLESDDSFPMPGLTLRIYNSVTEELGSHDSQGDKKEYIHVPCELNKNIEINLPGFQ